MYFFHMCKHFYFYFFYFVFFSVSFESEIRIVNIIGFRMHFVCTVISKVTQMDYGHFFNHFVASWTVVLVSTRPGEIDFHFKSNVVEPFSAC
jgi:hypothetical protein